MTIDLLLIRTVDESQSFKTLPQDIFDDLRPSPSEKLEEELSSAFSSIQSAQLQKKKEDY